MDVATEIKEAHIILEKGSRFEVPAPFLFRLFGKKTITLLLYQPPAAICLELTAMRLQMGVTDEEFENMSVEKGLSFLQENGATVARMLALALLRTSRRDKLYGKWLSKQLLKRYPFSTLLDMMHILTLGGGLQDFIHTMGLLRILRLTKPNDPSQKRT